MKSEALTVVGASGGRPRPDALLLCGLLANVDAQPATSGQRYVARLQRFIDERLPPLTGSRLPHRRSPSFGTPIGTPVSRR